MLNYRSSRRRKPLQETRADSYRRSLVWRWLNEGIRAQDDLTGDVVKLLRRRIDMPRSFPTRTHMNRYLDKCGIKIETAVMVRDRMWSLYREWVDHAKHNAGVTT